MFGVRKNNACGNREDRTQPNTCHRKKKHEQTKQNGRVCREDLTMPITCHLRNAIVSNPRNQYRTIVFYILELYCDSCDTSGDSITGNWRRRPKTWRRRPKLARPSPPTRPCSKEIGTSSTTWRRRPKTWRRRPKTWRRRPNLARPSPPNSPL